jgi:hypothetical protein
MLAGGIFSSTIGFGVTERGLLIIDDPVKGAAEAESASYRKRLLAEFRGALISRLHPGASAVVIASRWHAEDLAGQLLSEPGSKWTCVNTPAIAEAGIPDALRRDPGVAMISALGRDLAGFKEIKRAVGTRAWSALYQGVPGDPGGTLVRQSWLNDWRLPAAPPRPLRTVIGVDPSESGEGDACGLVACSIGSDGVVSVIALAVDVGASQIVVEAFQAATTYLRVVNEALARVRAPYIRVTAWPPKGSGRGGGDSVARSSALLAALESGRCRLAGRFAELEAAAISWHSGQHCPDALSALVCAFDELTYHGTRRCEVVAPDLGRRLGRPAPPGSGSATIVPFDSLLRARLGRAGYGGSGHRLGS